MKSANLYVCSFYYVLAMSFVYFTPLIMSDIFYIDDIGRSIYGYSDWVYNGRPLADIVMIMLSFGSPIMDISPLPQILSIISLCACSVLLIKSISNEYNKTFIFFSSMALISNPFYLENISYKFDSLTMTLSMCLLMACFFTKKKWVVNFLTGVVLIVSSLSLYQASIGCFIGIAIIESCFKIKNTEKGGDDDLYKVIALRVLQLIAGYLLYSFFISPNSVAGQYNIDHSKVISGTFSEVIDSFFYNFEIISSKLTEVARPVWVIFFIGLMLSYISYSIIIVKLFKSGLNRFDFIARSSILILSPLLVLAFGFIHLCFLAYPVVSPRVYISTGIFLMYFSISIQWLNIKNKLIYCFLSLLLLFFIVINYSYVNVLKSQNEMDRFIIKEIARELHQSNSTINRLSVIGVIPQSRQREYVSQKFHIIGDLVPLYMRDGWGWGSALLAHYGKAYFFENTSIDEIKEICLRKEADVVNGDYSIYYIKDKAIVAFNRPQC